MRKLLSANFSRLWKSKIFWVLEVISAIAGAVFYILAIINTKNIGENWYLASGNYYFFIGLVIVGAVMAVFTAFYVGLEYDHGTIRNKLNVGSTRNSIYLANLVVVVTAGILFTITHIAASAAVGLPFLGGLLWEALAPVGWRIPTAMVMLLCYAAVFTCIAMLDSNKSRSLLISFVLALAMTFGGLFTTARLNEPEFTSRMVMQADGSYQRESGLPNSRYISGTTRTIYAFVDACIPSAQAYNIARSEGEFNPLSVICLSGVTAVCTAAGVTLFKKKDIK